MKIASRVLGCVGAFTLAVVACNDKDISLISGDAGVGGSGMSTAGSGGSSSTAGQGGSGNNGGNGGTSGGAGAAGTPSGGSAGMSGAAGSGTDPDGGTDSGPPPGPYAEVCADYCAARTAWATATTDGGVNCPGWDSAGCQAGCEAEIAGFVDAPTNCAAYTAAIECYTTANVWYCQDGVVYNNNCEAGFCGRGDCDGTCNAQAGAVNTCLVGAPVCTGG